MTRAWCRDTFGESSRIDTPGSRPTRCSPSARRNSQSRPTSQHTGPSRSGANGGSTAGTQTTYIAYGNGGQNRPLVEGINTTEGTSAAGFYLDYGTYFWSVSALENGREIAKSGMAAFVIEE